MSAATIDLATFAELQDTAGGDFVKELVQTFLEEAPAMLKELRDAIDSGNADDFRRAAHSLKSNSLTFGAHRLGAMAREQELGGLAAAQQSNALDALALEYARVAAALTELTHG
ncbi:HPt (histidine-containing phosphotransfer) domain-containing protein [Variovorax sp. CF079]|uniref:Hpt domain-containing protein n=1 Tax=Variovorax sp. CF079 TaxID=1882774 RepID=UPI0008838355|nr:Hpt domain-containing protein [Variovorax sp. CF079]SDD65087.1 HPt (histidine-containing phosphotransfer) domain-containing protein [Variovorax sp. CF079]